MLKILDWLILDRETKELGALNKIHEDFNEKRLSPKQTREAIYGRRWRHHHSKLDFLVTATYLTEQLETNPPTS